MDDLTARVMRLQRAAWGVRRAAPVPCALPFALALMTDEAAQPDLVSSVERLPRGAPVLIVLRHYRTPRAERAALAAAAHRAARARGHALVVAGGGGDGGHNARRPGARRPGARGRRLGEGGLVSVSVHTLAEHGRKRGMSPALALVSPVFPTRSHPGAPALGVARAAALARALPLPAFALGGLDARGAARLRGTPFQGIAVLGAWEDRGEETGGRTGERREPRAGLPYVLRT